MKDFGVVEALLIIAVLLIVGAVVAGGYQATHLQSTIAATPAPHLDHFTQVNGGFYPGQAMGAGWLSATPIFPPCDNKPFRNRKNPKQCSAFKESGLTGMLLFYNWRVDDPFAIYEPENKSHTVDILIHFRQQYPQYEVE